MVVPDLCLQSTAFKVVDECAKLVSSASCLCSMRQIVSHVFSRWQASATNQDP